jgi:5-methyltetrahydrofolate--homocysteine methyltransferase
VILNAAGGVTDGAGTPAERLLALAEKIVAEGTGGAVSAKAAEVWRGQDAEERIVYAMVKGVDEYIEADVLELRGRFSRSLDIVEGPLMRGMREVGERFGAGKMFLPQVIRSARVMKKAVAVLEPFMEQEKASAALNDAAGNGAVGGAATIILATVKGDVHDIGKNIVGVVLGCNGYNIKDLGVMVPADTILDAAQREHAAVVGVSGLITPSLDEMVHIAREMERRRMSIPLIVGGATTSLAHTALRIAPEYSGPVVHVQDAGQCPAVLRALLSDSERPRFLEQLETKYREARARHDSIHSRIELIPLAEARANRVPAPGALPVPKRRGIIELNDYPLEKLIPRIDWDGFLRSWEMGGGVRRGASAARWEMSSAVGDAGGPASDAASPAGDAASPASNVAGRAGDAAGRAGDAGGLASDAAGRAGDVKSRVGDAGGLASDVKSRVGDTAGTEARERLLDDARAMLRRVCAEKLLATRGVVGIFPACAQGDDVVVFAAEGGTADSPGAARFAFLRSQDRKRKGAYNVCLADFVAPAAPQAPDSGKTLGMGTPGAENGGWVGLFALSAAFGLDEAAAAYRKQGDDYGALLLATLANSLAEAFSEEAHRLVAEEFWGYAAVGGSGTGGGVDGTADYGIRPAFGYPACPDHADKAMTFRLLEAQQRCGLTLTPSMMIQPSASVCGMYLPCPGSFYFSIVAVGEDQIADWARRKGIGVDEARQRIATMLPLVKSGE